MTPTNRHKSSETSAAFLGMATLGLAAIVTIVGLKGLADSLGPQLGDIVSFLPSDTSTSMSSSITVSPVNTSARNPCVLDMQVIQKSGGSLVIEATRSKPDRLFKVHWAGVRTSHGQCDCGNSADLLLNSVQITALIFAAGGKGVKSAQN